MGQKGNLKLRNLYTSVGEMYVQESWTGASAGTGSYYSEAPMLNMVCLTAYENLPE